MSNQTHELPPAISETTRDQFATLLDQVQRQENANNSRELTSNAWAAAHLVVNELCRDPDVSVLQRAAWTSAFQRRDAKSKPISVVDLPATARAHEDALVAIDTLLQERDAPILAVTTVERSIIQPHAITNRYTCVTDYALRLSAGTGLGVKQYYNPERNSFFHRADAREAAGILRASRIFGPDQRVPIIYGNPRDFIPKIASADRLFRALDGRRTGTHILIGESVLYEFLGQVRDAEEGSEDLNLIWGYLAGCGYSAV